MSEVSAVEMPTVGDFARTFRHIQAEIHKVIIGHEQAVEELLMALFAGGHVLIEGVPGTGKTTLVKTLGLALNLSFNRIQFTVDLMPADITGTRIILTTEDGRRDFQFQRGPVFCNILLGDEINRATPKTQSALLEAMAELQVTVAAKTYPLAPPFFVMATLNPIEMEGTYPLPEAQLDRFLFKVRLNFPSEEELTRIISSTTGPEEAGVEAAFPHEEAAMRIEALKKLVRNVIAAPAIEQYAARMVRATQPANSKFLSDTTKAVHEETVNRYVMFGSSPRGAQALILGGKVRALLDGRANVAREDIEAIAPSALSHRIMLNYAAHSDGIDGAHIVDRVVRSIQFGEILLGLPMLEARAFEPDFLRRLDRLVLGVRRARTVRAGQRTIGRVQGLGIEPENFKEYAAGDDLRFLDWNAFARLDDLLLRTYRAERQVEITVLLDASASMAMPQRDDKFGLARALAATFAYIGMAENDAVRIASFGARRGAVKLQTTPFYRRREQYQAFKPYLADLQCGGETRLSSVVGELLLQRRPAGVVVLISDFLVNQGDFEEAMLHLIGTRQEIKLVHVMGEMESEGSYPPGLYRVRDSESGELREVAFGPELARACRTRIAAITERIHDFCVGHAIVYAQAFGARHLDAILERELPVMGVIR